MGVGKCAKKEAGINGLMKWSISRCHVVGWVRYHGLGMVQLGVVRFLEVEVGNRVRFVVCGI